MNRNALAPVCTFETIDRWGASMGTTATLGVLALAGAAAAATSSPIGDWARGDGKAWVRIEPCGQKLCAINTWIRPGVTDEKVGDRLVLDVSPAGPSAFKGEAWDPQRRASFSFRMDVGERTMTTHGCVLAGLLCKDMGWTRRDAAN
jgi:uncharacterized protein (DUF2147 family)